jgi:signal transduction histidine kinase
MWFAIRIAACISLVLGYALLLPMAIRQRAGRGRVQQLLETILLLSALWTLGLCLLMLLTSGRWWSFLWHRIAQFGLVVLALLTADFADAFVQRHSRRGLRIGVVVLPCLAALALDAFSSQVPIRVAPAPFIGLGPSELATLLLAVAWLYASGTAWWTCMTTFRRARGSKHRNRLRYLGAMLFSFALGDLLIFVDGLPDTYVALAARLIGFSIAAFAILRYDLPDIRRLTLAGTRLILLGGLTAGLYLIGLVIAGYTSGALFSLSQPAVVGVSVGLALLIVAVVDVALRPRLQRVFDHTILGREYNIQKALRAYSEQINMILDLERLADTTLDWLQTSLHVERSAFILLTPQRNNQAELRVLRTVGFPRPVSRSFGATSRFIQHFQRIGRPLSQYDLDMLTWFQTMPAGEQGWLKNLGVDLYVPILLTDKPVALLALGSKAGEQPYSEEDMETLMILAGQTGIALENARLVDDLRAVQDDLHRLSTELAETNRQLKRLDQTKADFIAIASHELRTPLTQISGYSEILAGLEGDELGDAQEMHEFIEGISTGALRLKGVVDAMVDMSLIETRSLVLNLATLPMNVVVRNAIETIRPALGRRNQKLKVCDLGSLPDIQADRARLEQVCVSLLSNAIKFTPDGGEIVVSGRIISSASGGDFVELQVTDTGVGVDLDHQGLIFEKFYRPENPMLHSTDASRFMGAGPGLGLAIAKGIVEAHGGRIWVESPGRDEQGYPGSKFYVRVPVTGPRKG